MAVVIRHRSVARRVSVTRRVVAVMVEARRVIVAAARVPRAIVVVWAIAIDRALAIGRARRPVAGSGIGRALVHIVILGTIVQRSAILHFGIGEPLMRPAAAGVAARIAVGLDRSGVDRRGAGGEAARHRA